MMMNDFQLASEERWPSRYAFLAALLALVLETSFHFELGGWAVRPDFIGPLIFIYTLFHDLRPALMITVLTTYLVDALASPAMGVYVLSGLAIYAVAAWAKRFADRPLWALFCFLPARLLATFVLAVATSMATWTLELLNPLRHYLWQFARITVVHFIPDCLVLGLYFAIFYLSRREKGRDDAADSLAEVLK